MIEALSNTGRLISIMFILFKLIVNQSEAVGVNNNAIVCFTLGLSSGKDLN